MKTVSTHKLLIAALLALASPLSMAGHIDPQGNNLSVYSNNGAGSFQLKYEQYFSADGWVWNTGANAWNPSYAIPTPIITGGSVNGPAGPISIFPTDPTDPAAPFAGLIPYTYDPANPSIIDISIIDCCVHGRVMIKRARASPLPLPSTQPWLSPPFPNPLLWSC